MADKGTLRQIAAAKKRIAAENANRDQWVEQKQQAEEMLEAGGGEEVKALIDTMDDELGQIDAKLAQLREELALLEETLPKKPEPAAPKFDPEKHPLLKKAAEKVEPAKPVVFNVGDMCEAQWTDKQWYKAKVQMVLGSASAPKYNVRFIDYQDSALTVDRDAIRPLVYVNERKRKAEPAAPISLSTIPATSSPTVLSSPASINPNAIAAKKNPVPQTGGQEKKRKIGGSKALERKAQNWNSFLSKGVGKKVAQKESMFRSGTTPRSKVGFTGSGSGMTEVQKPVRYNKNKVIEMEDGEEGDGGQDSGSRAQKDDWQLWSRH